MKSGDLQSCEVITDGEAYGDHHSAVSQSLWVPAAFAPINVILAISAMKRGTRMRWAVPVPIRKSSRFLLLYKATQQLASAGLYAGSGSPEQRDPPHQKVTLDNFHHDTKPSAPPSYTIVSSVPPPSSAPSTVPHLPFPSRSSSNAIKNHSWLSSMPLAADVSIKINAPSSS